MNRLISVEGVNDIPQKYQNTPAGLLLEYHNLGRPFEIYDRAQILIGMCMDNRKHLNIPDNFAYIIRTGGANLRYSEFKVSYAIAIGRIRYIALIGHSNCGMVNLISRRDEFVNGLMQSAGWEKEKAEEHFMNYAPMFEIDNEIDFVINEARRLQNRYPGITIVPMYYRVEDHRLYLVDEK